MINYSCYNNNNNNNNNDNDNDNDNAAAAATTTTTATTTKIIVKHIEKQVTLIPKNTYTDTRNIIYMHNKHRPNQNRTTQKTQHNTTQHSTSHCSCLKHKQHQWTLTPLTICKVRRLISCSMGSETTRLCCEPGRLKELYLSWPSAFTMTSSSTRIFISFFFTSACYKF